MDSVVVTHGVWMPGSETLLLRRRLEAHGLRAYAFHYHSVGEDLDRSAARLARFLEAVPGETAHLVGHSLGGVVILWMLMQHTVRREGRVVCLGSPLNGCRTASALAALPGGRLALGKSLEALLTCGGLPPWDGRRPVGVVAGQLPIGLGSLVARLPRPNDGAVAVEETRLAGLADHVVVRASHMALLWSKAAIGQTICFLDRGRFCRPTARRPAPPADADRPRG